ncbi:MAG: Hsp20/alpha crystallin family protein [Nocardioides sp.]
MTTLTRFKLNPVAEMLNWLDAEPPLSTRGLGLSPFVRVEDFVEDGVYVVRAEVPGIDPDKDLQVTLDNDVLTIRGERRQEQRDREHREFHYGSFSRSLRLPTGTRADDITAAYADGVLELRAPVDIEQATPLTIPIKRSNGRPADTAEK